MSRSALEVRLELYEIEALIAWHHDQKWQSADKQDFIQAAAHKERIANLENILEQRLREIADETQETKALTFVPVGGSGK